MNTIKSCRASTFVASAAAFILATLMGAAARADSAPPVLGSAAALTARFIELKSAFASNQFKRPLVLTSKEGSDLLAGDIYAIVDHSFAAASAALSQPGQWCEVMILHLNTKFCKPTIEASGPQLHVSIGKKFDQPVDKAYRVDFNYQLAARTEHYLQVRLSAEEGPLSTRDYRIILEATPAGPGQTYMRLTYSYGYGTMAQLAMRAYLATVGRNKIGFTMVNEAAEGQPQPVGGMRGVVERNTMRYYLAIESYLGALSAPPATRAEKGFKDWFQATETYPRQLHEMERAEYLDMKRTEYQRQQSQRDPLARVEPQ